MTRRLLTRLALFVTGAMVEGEAQKDIDDLLAKLPSLINSRLRPNLTRQDMLLLLQRVEPIEILADGSVKFGGDVTHAAIDLGLIQK